MDPAQQHHLLNAKDLKELDSSPPKSYKEAFQRSEAKAIEQLSKTFQNIDYKNLEVRMFNYSSHQQDAKLWNSQSPTPTEPNMNNLTWKKYYPLSDKNGFICLVDKMGDDSSIVQAARVSFDGDAPVGRAISDKTKKKILTDNEFETLLKKANAIMALSSVSYDQDSTFVVYYNETESVRIKKSSREYDIVLQLHEQQLIEDRQLIRYLMNHSHTTPFEMVEFKFMVQVPMDCWRQWIRHRTANVNEYSTRYTEALDMQQVTLPGEWRLQATDNKQGSSGYLTEWPENISKPEQGLSGLWYVKIEHTDGHIFKVGPFAKEPTIGEFFNRLEENHNNMNREQYLLRIKAGIAKEQARKDLPLSTYTRAYWKCDLHNIFNFLRLRMDSHAQLEIRSYANCMYEIVKQVCPVACEAFEDYVLHAKRFSKMEMEVIKILLARSVEKEEVMQEFSYDDTMSREEANLEWHGRLRQAISETTTKPNSMTDREWKEFLAKLS